MKNTACRNKIDQIAPELHNAFDTQAFVGDIKTPLLLITAKAAVGYNIAPPLGVYQLYHYVTQRGVKCDLLDRELEAEEDYIRKAESGTYDVIGISLSHMNMEDELDLLWRLRVAAERSGKRVLFIAGGQEATMNWEQWLDVGIDLIFMGFAEKRLFEFCVRLSAKLDEFRNGLEIDAIAKGMMGIAYISHRWGPTYLPAPQLTLDEFRELFFDQVMTIDMPFHTYWDMLRRKSADTTLGASAFVIENIRLYTTSHCPRRCGFCNSQSFLTESQTDQENLMTKWEGWIASKGKLPIIQLSAEETAKLILMYVNRYGAKSFLFSDDDFPVGSKQGLARVHDFCSIIVDYKRDGLIPEGVTFSCQARVADFLKRVKKQTIPNWEILEIMKQAGFHSIGMGVETFSDKLLLAPSVNKMGIKVSDCRLIIDAMLTIGLVPQINIILGIPESTVEELVETMEIAVHYITQGCDVAVSRRLLALPGAPIYDAGLYELRSNKWINPVNGQEVLIADYFVPGDPVIAEAMDTMEQEAADELKRITREKGWEGKIVHKRVVGMSALIALSRLIKRNDVAAQFRSVLDDILDEPAKFRKLYPSFSE